MNVISRLLLWLLLKSEKGGGIQMIIVMASLIIYGDITIAQVPTGSKAAVKTRLATLGYDENGTPLKIEE
ncbi:hypothetical protein [Paenibacillus odorifer]|uniref:hypothetical protein n=1 Tax=Paenibacillus odorifer TaxID=189426 RepID=UPI00117C7243|nr:hypothetical protein [Paenibacillus odorifer]